MLVLTRKTNEAIQIGDDIEVKVLEIDGDQIKLGIAAPSQVEIHRKEVYLEIQQENNQAANTSPDVLNLIKKIDKKD
ncbi:carbon storage regulator [Gracilibacillus halophilus YIM-C55.5]|uniref:Translational regulator CsrA n=1 Tax=Gracilibacillus halophilus YIM-C55.5 TaxID=1308866 RepID=N4WZD9_9BACI|nr:carbon storage regulator CsrA [Gracilibacillus halophilus]ENH98396.1 carbon storage regulator [Gracilibacillus halophilus YIM-C55.5]